MPFRFALSSRTLVCVCLLLLSFLSAGACGRIGYEGVELPVVQPNSIEEIEILGPSGLGSGRNGDLRIGQQNTIINVYANLAADVAIHQAAIQVAEQASWEAGSLLMLWHCRSVTVFP